MAFSLAAAVGGLGLVGSSLAFFSSPQDSPALEISFLDVGQGDAVLLRSPEGKAALIDAGPGERIVELLEKAGVQELELVVATHAHADHIGGMASVLRSFPVKSFMDNGVPHTTNNYLSLLRMLEDSQVTYLAHEEGVIQLGSVRIVILPPPEVPSDDLNESSIGILVEYGDFRALLTGDSGPLALNRWLGHGVPKVTVLKAPHHGARDGVTPGWLAATRPEVVVVSCGKDNPYGHPDPWALRYYSAVAEEVLRTDLNGTVSIRGQEDGTYYVQVERRSDSHD